jgi:hypothetical protein
MLSSLITITLLSAVSGWTAEPAAPAKTPAAPAPKTAPAPTPAKERSLFDGESLGGWKPSEFDTQAGVKVDKLFRDGQGAIVAEKSGYLSGITWGNAADLPATNYEISLEAMKLDGDDFFCGLTFPVGKTACTFVVGGWGGMVVGLSSVDGYDASENETTQGKRFDANRWYRIRVRVTPEKIEAWIDDEKMVDLETTGHKIGLRGGGIEASLPLGLAAFQTRAAWRDITLRRL